MNINSIQIQPASPDSDHDIEVESVPDDDVTSKQNEQIILEEKDSLYEKPKTITKIFKPDQSMFKDMDENFITQLPESRNSFYQTDLTTRRSAFTVPSKSKRDDNVLCKTKIMAGAPPLLENRQAIIRGRKRSYPYMPHEREAIAYCCCGSHNCKVKVIDYSSEDSETESLYSYGSVSPHEFQTTNYPSRKIYFEQSFEQNPLPTSNSEYILRKDSSEYREREETQLLKLQHNLELNKKTDPFMGYDYSENPFVCDSFDELLSDGGLYKSTSQLC